MYTLLIGAGLFALMSLIFSIFIDEDWETNFFSFFVGAFIGFLIGGFVALLLPTKRIEEKTVSKLVTMQDNSSISGGRFFLGSGQINGIMKYVFYYEAGDNVYKMGQIDYDDAVIKYSSDSTATIEQYENVVDLNNPWNKWSFPFDEDTRRYIINVPKGTIRTDFKLDAQ